MKVYIAGKITGNPSYKQQFAEAEKKLREAVFFLSNWQDSIGATMEYNYAFEQNKGLMFEEG